MQRNFCREVDDIVLCNPEDVLKALKNNTAIINWLNFIANEYTPPKSTDILLIYPCTSVKPYYESRSYKALYKTLNRFNSQKSRVHLMTISEPFGLVPEEFYNLGWRYDCPGLFEWWCKRNGETFNKEYLNEAIDILSSSVGEFLKRAYLEGFYQNVFAFLRSYSSSLLKKQDHTHRRIIEQAKDYADININIMPSKDVVKEIVDNSGAFAWDMYGVAHPQAQDYLFNRLGEVLI